MGRSALDAAVDRPPPGCVDLWAIDLDAFAGDVSVLDAEERSVAERRRRPLDASRYVAAHSELRRILGAYLRRNPGEIRLARTGTGKPVLAGQADIAFSLSHSGGAALLAVSSAEVGVDLEATKPLPDLHGLARLVFCEDEFSQFCRLEPAWRPAAFFRVWTSKEAVLKAGGWGLLLDPRSVRVGIGARTSLDVQVTGPSAPAVFLLRRFRIAQRLYGAVAIAGPAEPRGCRFQAGDQTLT